MLVMYAKEDTDFKELVVSVCALSSVVFPLGMTFY
jgi:hypothetical protein